MRIWSKVLVPYLPKKQLMAMRYELGDMIKQYPNIKHGLVKFANNYDIGYLGYYFCYVCDELDNRGVNTSIGYEAVSRSSRSLSAIGIVGIQSVRLRHQVLHGDTRRQSAGQR